MKAFLDAEYTPSVIEQSLSESHVSWFVAVPVLPKAGHALHQERPFRNCLTAEHTQHYGDVSLERACMSRCASDSALALAGSNSEMLSI